MKFKKQLEFKLFNFSFLIDETKLIKVIDLSRRKLTFQATCLSFALRCSRFHDIEPYQSNRLVGFVLVTNRNRVAM